MGSKYSSLNVLAQRSFVSDYEDRNAVNEVAAMIEASGNRKNRRRIERALNKTVNIAAHADKKATERANKQLEIKAEKDLVWLYSMVGYTLVNDYHWKENADNDHGQISSFFDRLTKNMNQFINDGYTVDEVAKEFEELTGIALVAQKQ